MRISDWSSDVCSSDLAVVPQQDGEDDGVPSRLMLGGDENGTLGQVLAPAHLVAQSAEDRQRGQDRMRPEASEIIDAAARPQQEWKADDHAECCPAIEEGVE